MKKKLRNEKYLVQLGKNIQLDKPPGHFQNQSHIFQLSHTLDNYLQ